MNILITDDQYAADVERSLELRTLGYLIQCGSRGCTVRLGERVLYACTSNFEGVGAPYDPMQIRAHLVAALAVAEREQERIEQRALQAARDARSHGDDDANIAAATFAVFVQEGLKPGEQLRDLVETISNEDAEQLVLVSRRPMDGTRQPAPAV